MELKNKINHWAESNERTHVLHIEVLSKSGKWIERNKIYSQDGFGPEDLEKYHDAYLAIYSPFDVRILNALHKQVYSSCSRALDFLFRYHIQFAKLVSIKAPDEKFYIENLIDISNSLNNFKCRIMEESNEHGGMRSISNLIASPEDNYLKWFKIHFNDGYRLHVALYS